MQDQSPIVRPIVIVRITAVHVTSLLLDWVMASRRHQGLLEFKAFGAVDGIPGPKCWEAFRWERILSKKPTLNPEL